MIRFNILEYFTIVLIDIGIVITRFGFVVAIVRFVVAGSRFVKRKPEIVIGGGIVKRRNRYPGKLIGIRTACGLGKRIGHLVQRGNRFGAVLAG